MMNRLKEIWITIRRALFPTEADMRFKMRKEKTTQLSAALLNLCGLLNVMDLRREENKGRMIHDRQVRHYMQLGSDFSLSLIRHTHFDHSGDVNKTETIKNFVDWQSAAEYLKKLHFAE